MSRVISVHEYRLKEGVTGEQFETAVRRAREQGLFNLPGLTGYHFLRRLRGTRTEGYAAVWIYQDLAAWESLWGPADQPISKERYPEAWKVWEAEILAPLLSRTPDRIDYAAYQEF